MRAMIYFFTKKLPWFFKKHIWVDLQAGNIRKPLHFLMVAFRHRFLGYPYSAIVETGNYCNLQCATCPTPQKMIHRKKELMSFENFKKVIDNIKDLVYLVHLYSCNEPLLHPDIFKMSRYAHENNLFTSISTNATLLSKEKTKELFESGLDEIILCLDGTTKETYEPFRGGADFEKVFQNIKYVCQQKQALKLKKPFIELQFIINKLNYRQVGDIKKLAKDLKVDRLHIKTLNLGRYAYSEKEIEDLSNKFFPDARNFEGKARYKKEGKHLVIKNSLNRCPMAKSQVVILVNGDISICCYDLSGEYIVDNVLNQKLRSAWFSKKAQQIRKLAYERRYPLCKVCSIFK